MRIPILMYHIVDEALANVEKYYCVSKENFETQMSFLSKKGFSTISLYDLCNAVSMKTQVPEKSIIIAFDDGYRDNLEHALPVLKGYNFTATIFLTTALIGKTNQWNRHDGYPQRPLLTWKEIEIMRKQGISFGSHTHTHRHLDSISFDETVKELMSSRNIIEKELGEKPDFLAYPYGSFNLAVKKAARMIGYHAACSVKVGLNKSGDDLFTLKRIPVYNWDTPSRLSRKLTFGTVEGTISTVVKYYNSRIKAYAKNIINGL